MSSQYLKRSRVDFENQDYSSQEVKVQQTINWDDEISIRRDNINKLISPDNKRIFNLLLQRANQRLRNVFGFELQEATLKDKSGVQQQDLQAQTQSTQAESSTQAQTQKQTTAGNVSGVYFLRNVMKEHYILPEIVKRPKEEYVQTGVLYVILALLFVNEYEMDSLKYQYLKKTKLDDQEGEEIEYRFQWGARAYAELPCQNMVEFISNVSIICG
ncbi:hypothetical protein RO3G_15535 [Rhizopus delemar RA 99-880]|uniref:MAGE domain-containing protein n=1 Tax=Rhizopus delemar (strain RA 99-880 / ATCC MYA-4621 / FGSC 9543 / NRRL 43880) TaxID=246409 RepID=I1CQU4_RHIO9|nr:hypothetical protein RO3G_15535 [Rhizopus delemar RA 99-880]|eukprot:EIE90824.1 hypothetical protein RO3G_15535 [Rhizopus delemar RA 99-880]